MNLSIQFRLNTLWLPAKVTSVHNFSTFEKCSKKLLRPVVQCQIVRFISIFAQVCFSLLPPPLPPYPFHPASSSTSSRVLQEIGFLTLAIVSMIHACFISMRERFWQTFFHFQKLKDELAIILDLLISDDTTKHLLGHPFPANCSKYDGFC